MIRKLADLEKRLEKTNSTLQTLKFYNAKTGEGNQWEVDMLELQKSSLERDIKRIKAIASQQ